MSRMRRRSRSWGREFDGFRRAVATHAAAWPAGGGGDGVRTTWLGLPELEAAVLGPEPPDADLLIVPADWLPALAAGGRIRALTPYLDQTPPEGWPSAWSPSFHEGVTWGSDVYGLPFHDGPQLLFTRPSLLAVRGLEPPATWSELVAQAAVLQEPGVRSGTVLAGAPDGHNNVYDLVLHLRRFGGDLVDAEGRIVLDTAPMRAGLAFLRESVTTLVSPAAHGLDSPGSGAEFAARRVGVAVNWAGFAALAAAGAVADDFACAVVPTHDDGRPTVTVNAFWVTCIGTSCADPDRAWDYLRHATSAAMDLETTRAGASGARRSTWADPDLLDAHPEHALFEQAHAHSRPLPRVPELPALVGVLNELVDAVVWRGEPAEPALAAATRAVTTLGASALDPVPTPRSSHDPHRRRRRRRPPLPHLAVDGRFRRHEQGRRLLRGVRRAPHRRPRPGGPRLHLHDRARQRHLRARRAAPRRAAGRPRRRRAGRRPRRHLPQRSRPTRSCAGSARTRASSTWPWPR